MQTPLHWAAFGGCYATTSMLLDMRANPSLEDRFGRRADHIATAKGLADIARLIHEARGAGNVVPRPGAVGLADLWTFWTPDAEAKRCMVCAKGFTLFNRK